MVPSPALESARGGLKPRPCIRVVYGGVSSHLLPEDVGEEGHEEAVLLRELDAHGADGVDDPIFPIAPQLGATGRSP